VGVKIEINQDLETAIARLASRSPEMLAAFIASLAFDAGPVAEQVRTFIVGDNLSRDHSILEGTYRCAARLAAIAFSTSIS
jgi:hypothetical protein